MANTTRIYQDAENGNLCVEVRDAGGTIVATSGRVFISLGDVDDAPPGFQEAKFRELQWRDQGTCVLYHAWVLMTEPQPV